MSFRVAACSLPALIIATFAAGCDRAGAASQPAPPKDVMYALLRAHSEHDDGAFRTLVRADRHHGLVTTLRAVDRFLSAETKLRGTLRHSFGDTYAETVNLSRFASHLGVFSADVELLDQRISGDTAIVTYLVAGTPPAREAKLVLEAGRWRYDPGEGFDEQWPRVFDKMAEVLTQTADEIQSNAQAAKSAYADPQTFLQELAARLSTATEGLNAAPQPSGG